MNLNELLAYAVDNSASDLHIVPNSQPFVRIDGTLLAIKEEETLSSKNTEALIEAILTEEQKATFKKKHVVEFAHVTEKGNFRVSVFHQLNGVAGVFRVVSATVPTFASLNLPLILKPVLTGSRGLIFVVGPAGAGKSTSLAAMIDYVNQNRICHIITIEDPIEFIHHNKRCVVSQIQVGRDTPNFAAALRSSLRQDPNVILLGELRDLETMRLALTAVETGHLVLATIHASSAPLAISRFVDVFPLEEQQRVRTLLSEMLEAVICQRLVKKKAEKGRVAVFEVMLVTQAVKNYIRRDMPSHMESAMQTGGAQGMVTFEAALAQLVQQNVISPMVAETTTKEIRSFSVSLAAGGEQ